MTGIRTNSKFIPGLIVNGKIESSNLGKVDILAKEFQKVNSHTNQSKEFCEQKRMFTVENCEVLHDWVEYKNDLLN